MITLCYKQGGDNNYILQDKHKHFFQHKFLHNRKLGHIEWLDDHKIFLPSLVCNYK